MADVKAIAKNFTDYYYQTFDAGRANLRPLYREMSMLSFEGEEVQGVNNIMQKLENLGFTKTQHTITSIDAQPSNPQAGSLLVAVTGKLNVDGEGNALPYCQTFQLIHENGSFWVYNDIFRLNYG